MSTEKELVEWFTYHEMTEEQKKQSQDIAVAIGEVLVLFEDMLDLYIQKANPRAEEQTTIEKSVLTERLSKACLHVALTIQNSTPSGRNQDLAIQYTQIAKCSFNEGIHQGYLTEDAVVFQQARYHLRCARWFANTAIVCDDQSINPTKAAQLLLES